MINHRSCYVHQHLHRDFIKNVLLFYHLPKLKRHYLLQNDMKRRSNHLRINLANGYTRDKAQMLKT